MTGSAPVTWTTAADGARLAERRWMPDGTVRGTVQLVHGLSEHAGRYERLAGALTARGLAVAALDQRGHGLTVESTGPGSLGAGATTDAVLDDVRDLGRRLAADHPAVPRFLLGHSLGSAVALASAERDGAGLSGLVLSGPIGVAPHLAEAVPQLQAAVAGGMGDQPMDVLGAFNAPFEPPRTPYDWLTRDPGEVDAYRDDPLCGDDVPPTYGYGAAMFELVTQAAHPEGLAGLPDGLPVLLLAGQRDPVGGVEAAQVAALTDLLRARGLPVQLRIYPDARHEVFNETNRDEVTGDLLSWLDERIGAAAR